MFKQYEYKILHKRIMFTMFVLLIYIIGSHIPLVAESAMTKGTSSFYRLAVSNMGGNIVRLNVFSLGLGPWLTAMLILSLLSYKNMERAMRQTRAEKHYKEKLLTLILCFLQGVFVLNQFVVQEALSMSNKALFLLILIAGAMFMMWLADQNVRHGIAGPMPIVMLSIVSAMFNQRFIHPNLATITLITMLMLLLLALFTLLMIELIEYRTTYRDIMEIKQDDSVHYLAWKLNPSGSITIMIGLSVFLILNSAVSLIVHFAIDQPVHITLFSFDNVIGISFYLILQIILGYFLSRIMINTRQTAKNFLKSGNYFVGVRPGLPTAMYLDHHAKRVCWFGTVMVGLIIGVPLYASLWVPHLSQQIYLAVQMIILVYIGINIADTFRTYLYFDKYKQFLNKYW
nr:accessory Sec system protein translocase subunit SecY2 [Staphylococcus lutrae]